MEFLSQLNENRALAGLKPLSEEAAVELMEKKLKGKDKEEFLAKMGGKSKAKDGVDGGSGEEASKGAKKAMDKASIKGSVSGEKGVKMKKKVSEQLNAVLEGAGLKALSEADAAKIDATYPEEDAE